MIKTTQSILLATLLAASGLAAAQNPAVPATRAEVKSEATTGERKLGTGETAKSATGTAAPGTTVGTTPATTRAEVKSEAGTAERKLGTGETAKPNMSGSAATQGNTSGTTRAEVKSDAGTEPRKLGTGEVAKSGNMSGGSSGNASGMTRTEVKSEAGMEPRKLGTGEVAKSGNTSASSAERKRMRDERRAAAKAKRQANMKSGSGKMAAPVTEKAP